MVVNLQVELHRVGEGVYPQLWNRTHRVLLPECHLLDIQFVVWHEIRGIVPFWYALHMDVLGDVACAFQGLW